VKLGEIAVRFGLELRGDPDAEVHSVATLAGARPGTLAFLANPRYRRALKSTSATAVVLSAADAPESPVAALVAANPYAAYARIATVLHPEPAIAAGIHPAACVESSARVAASASVGANAVIEAGVAVGERAVIGPGCVVMQGATVGDDSRLVANVTIYRGVHMGRRCVVHAGAVIGADGFGFAPDRGAYVKVPQVGSVRLGDDVEIGANTTVDRGAIEDTVLEDGVKLDNLVMVGHNCHIGEHTVLAGCVGVSGSVTIGKRCMLGGAVGVVGHIEIADDVAVTGLTMVSRSLKEPGVYSSGMPAIEAGDWRKAVARLRHLDELFDRVARLEGRRRAPTGEGSEGTT
jgi:UDP-3-O-[3-hydroxymyristoyl] glucosamine N-acyltransferase